MGELTENLAVSLAPSHRSWSICLLNTGHSDDTVSLAHSQPLAEHSSVKHRSYAMTSCCSLPCFENRRCPGLLVS